MPIAHLLMQTGKTLHVDVNTRGLWERRQWENEGTYIHEYVYERHKDDICTQFVVVSDCLLDFQYLVVLRGFELLS